MFEIFGASRIVNIYMCDVNPIALKVVHPEEEEDLDVNEDSQYYEFNEEEEEMVQTESNTVPCITFIQSPPTLIEPQNEQEEEMVQTESNTEPHPTYNQP